MLHAVQNQQRFEIHFQRTLRSDFLYYGNPFYYNSGRYPDPTAAQALANIAREKRLAARKKRQEKKKQRRAREGEFKRRKPVKPAS